MRYLSIPLGIGRLRQGGGDGLQSRVSSVRRVSKLGQQPQSCACNATCTQGRYALHQSLSIIVFTQFIYYKKMQTELQNACPIGRVCLTKEFMLFDKYGGGVEWWGYERGINTFWIFESINRRLLSIRVNSLLAQKVNDNSVIPTLRRCEEARR